MFRSSTCLPLACFVSSLWVNFFLFVSFRLSFVVGQAAPNPDCTLTVPANPLSASGLSTPFQLAGLNAATAGPCNMANNQQSTFVQGSIIDSSTGVISIYNPLVIDAGTSPASPNVVPSLTGVPVVALWFGSNANTLTLIDVSGSLAAGNCVNGLTVNAAVDVFGQYAYCNAPAWFSVANTMITNGMLTVPPIGTYNIPASGDQPAMNGVTCPTVRDFRVVDQDQSDNMVTSYLLTSTGTTAQDTLTNRARLPTATSVVNPSDNRLISVAIANAIGCTPFTAPDLANPGGPNIPALPLNELQAAAYQRGMVALVPANDPMAKVKMTTQNLNKVNMYRAGVNQDPASALNTISGTQYCLQYMSSSPVWIAQNKVLLDTPGSSPAPTQANTLYTFMAMRMNAAINSQTLNCQAILNVPNAPFIMTMDANGVITSAQLDPQFTAQLIAAGGNPSPLRPKPTTSAASTVNSAALLQMILPLSVGLIMSFFSLL